MLWQQLTEPVHPGSAPPVRPRPSPPPPPLLPDLDEPELRTPATVPNPPPVALFEVDDPVPIVHAAPSEQPVVLDGDGEGIVDAIGAGLLDGNQLVLRAGVAWRRRALQPRSFAPAPTSCSPTPTGAGSEQWFTGVRDNTGRPTRAGTPVGGPGEQRLPRSTCSPVPTTRAGPSSSSTAVTRRASAAFGPARSGGTRVRRRPPHRVARRRRRRRRPAARAAHTEGRCARRPRHAGAAAGARRRARHHQGAASSIDDGAPITVDLGPDRCSRRARSCRSRRAPCTSW